MALQTLNPPPPLAPPGMQNNNLNFLPPSRRRKFLDISTLSGRFQALAGLVIVLAVVAMAVSYFVLSAARQNFGEIVVKVTPSIDAAQRLGQSLEEMDARAADYQLTSRIDVTSPDLNPAVYGAQGIRFTAWRELEERRRRVDNALALARSNARPTSDSQYRGEADTINVLSNRFYDYFAKINLMRYELDLGRKEAALANYKAANDILVGNLGNVELDARGNSPEKALKDNNWKDVDFTCKTNCAPANQDKARKIQFNTADTYLGLAANVRKLSEINRKRLDAIGNFGTLETILVGVTAGLVIIAVLLAGAYYALITHRVINIGFGLAFIGGLVIIGMLFANLSSASQDYNEFSKKYIPSVISAASIQQLSASASADISRLLLSPDSPGLDSTNPSLTSDVKQAFLSDNLLNAYDVKKKQVEQELENLSNLIGTGSEERQTRSDFCEAYRATACPRSTVEWAWIRFTTAVDTIKERFGKNLLADAIAINISPSATQTQASARDPYNVFATKIESVSTQYKKRFDESSCKSIGVSEFGNTCVSDGGYLNWLQVVVLVMFPLLTIMVLGGVWFANRLF